MGKKKYPKTVKIKEEPDLPTEEYLTYELQLQDDAKRRKEGFANWVGDQLKKRGWSRKEAARRAGLSSSIFDKVINGQSDPGLEFVKGVSKIFEMPVYKVLNQAGIIDGHPAAIRSEAGAEVLRLFNQLSPGDQEELIRIARLKIGLQKQREEED